MGEEAKLQSERDALTFGGRMLQPRVLAPPSFSGHALLGTLATSPQKLESLLMMSLGVKINDMSSLFSGLSCATGVSILSMLTEPSICACEDTSVDCAFGLTSALLVSLDRYAYGEVTEGAAACSEDSRADTGASLSLSSLSYSLLPTSAEIWYMKQSQ